MTPEQIAELAGASPLARYSWRGRGVAPRGYVKGLACTFARALEDLRAGKSHAVAMARANTGRDGRDALSWLDSVFKRAGMRNGADGEDTLRHLFVLLYGLGMRESSGRYCEGRDRSASNTTADSAESGLFQQSWDSRAATPELPKLLREHVDDGLLAVYKEGVTPHAGDLEIYGSGDGARFQRLCKESPSFAAFAAGLGLRDLRRHWGPINRREVELLPQADELLKQVASLGATDKETDMAGWRVATSLLKLIDQVNQACPGRAKGADGTIGDQSHQARASDHNPNRAGVVTACDITHDPFHGVDMRKMSESLRASRDKRIKYLIFNRRIMSSEVSPWTWRPYNGANPHDHHMHVSVKGSAALWDDTTSWQIGDMTPVHDAPPAERKPVLRINSTGPDVRYLQQLLGHSPVDGLFGANTRASVVAFQKENGLVADGVVGDYTWSKLLEKGK